MSELEEWNEEEFPEEGIPLEEEFPEENWFDQTPSPPRSPRRSPVETQEEVKVIPRIKRKLQPELLVDYLNELNRSRRIGGTWVWHIELLKMFYPRDKQRYIEETIPIELWDLVTISGEDLIIMNSEVPNFMKFINVPFTNPDVTYADVMFV